MDGRNAEMDVEGVYHANLVYRVQEHKRWHREGTRNTSQEAENNSSGQRLTVPQQRCHSAVAPKIGLRYQLDNRMAEDFACCFPKFVAGLRR